MAIQVRRGNEADFDASKMLPGEWAVSLDTKYVRMCFAPGIVLRMATYEGFEADKAQFQAILAECRSIQEVVRRIGNEVSEKASLTIEYSNSAKKDAERAKLYADKAEAVTGVNIATQDRAGLVKGGDNYIAEDGTLTLIKQTAETTMPNSHDGRLKIDSIEGGESQQESTSGNQLFDGVDQHYYLNGGCTQGGANSGDTGFALEVSGGTYTVSTKVAQTRFRVACANELGTAFNCFNGVNKDNRDTVTSITIDCTGHSYLIVNATDLSAIMVNAGTSALPWEPYTNGASPNPSYPQEIKKTVVSEIRTHGKNFFGFGKSTIDATAEFRPNAGQRLNLSIVDGNPNKIKCNFAGGGYSSGYVKIIGVDGTKDWAVSFTVESNTTSYKPSLKKDSGRSNSNQLVLFFTADNGATHVNSDQYFVLSNIQVEEGTVATDYEPYTESVVTLSQPIELYGKGDVQDVIEGGKVKRNWKIITLSADKDWKLSSSGKNYYYTEKDGKTINGKIYSTHFRMGKWQDNTANLICMGNGQTSIIGISALSFASLDELKTFLTNNDVKVVYELAEETTEELPIADQIALNSLSTYDGITYLEFDSEIEPTFKGEYGTSKVGGYTLEGMLAGRNGELYGSRINALEASVVNNI